MNKAERKIHSMGNTARAAKANDGAPRTVVSLFSIFLYSLRLSCMAFGGGYVLISLMRETYVRRLGWLTEDEMLDVTALSQSAPGASAVNAAVLTGSRLAGWRGALSAVCGTIIPPLFIMSLIAAVYDLLGQVAFIGRLMTGMQCGVAAVILDAAIGMTRSALSSKKILYIIIFALAFISAVWLKVPVIYVIMLSAAAGLADCAVSSGRLIKKTRGEDR